MTHYATILSGDETLAADILTDGDGLFVVRAIDEACRRDAGIDAVVSTWLTRDVDTAFVLANAWVTQTPVQP